MPGTMSSADLVADLKASLQDAANAFVATGDADFIRHLSVAALDFSRIRPRTLLGEINLVADQINYAAPADMHMFKAAVWGASHGVMPWEPSYPGKLPTAQLVSVGDSPAQELHLTPAPSAKQISVLGPLYKFWYFAQHKIDADATKTTIHPSARALLLLRAQAEAMRELAMRNITKPVSMRDGLSSAPRNGTPSALYQALMKEFEDAAAH